MDKGTVKVSRGSFIVFCIISCFMFLLTMKIENSDKEIPKPHGLLPLRPSSVTNLAITPLKHTKHLLLSAFMDRRSPDFDIRIIGIFKTDSVGALSCLFWSNGKVSAGSNTKIQMHSDNFGFPYMTTDVLCLMPENFEATHVTLVTEGGRGESDDHTWLPIRNIKTKESEGEMLKHNFTVCISTLFDDYNNVLQFAQALEMYR